MTDVRIPRLLTIRQASAVTGLPRWRIYELLQQGRGPRAMRIGRTLRIAESELLRWIELETAASAEAGQP